MRKLAFLILALLSSYYGHTQSNDCETAILASIGVNYTPTAPYYFTYTSTQREALTISTAGTGRDTHLKVYDECGGIVLAENDDIDIGAAIYQSELTIELSLGQTIKIEWLDTWESVPFEFQMYQLPYSVVSESDSLALVALYNSTNGSNWNKKTNWLTSPVSYWYGITAEDGGVTEINLKDNGLSGALPAELANISTLQSLVIDGNELDGLSDLTSLPVLSEFSISDNYLTFEDFELNASVITSNTSQKPFGEIGFRTLNLGDNITLNPSWADASSNNVLQWEKNSENINAANAPTYNIPSLSSSDEGVYILKVTNSDFPSVVLKSNPITLSLPLLETDSLALVALYNATGGQYWENNANWLNDPVNTWYGIKLKGGRVSEILLPNNNLYGFLPDQLWQLTALEALDISNSSFFEEGKEEYDGMSLPPEIAMLSNLKHLNLSSIYLRGSLPAELGSLTKLEYLNLGDGLSRTIVYSNENRLDLPLPSEFGNLINLKTLSLSGIRDVKSNSAFPEIIMSLTNLETLRMYFNPFADSLPSSIENLTNLKHLKIDIPLTESLKNLSLTTLDISYNPNWGIDLTTLTNVEELVFRSSKLDSLPSLPPSLKSLDIGDNRFYDIPDLSGSAIESLIIDLNYLEFDDLESGAPEGINEFVYVPQKEFGSIQERYVHLGDAFTFSFDVPGSANSYRIRGEEILGPEYSVEPVTLNDDGDYQLTVTNSLVPDLVLKSAPALAFILPDLPIEGELFDRVDGGDLTQYGKDLQLNYGGQWADIDNDGFEDVIVTNYAANHPIRSYMFKNDGNGKFSKVNSNNYGFASGRNAAFGDYNNDGFIDYFSPNLLIEPSVTFPTDTLVYASIQKNNGDGTFSPIYLNDDVALKSGTWLDVDNDGDLDLLVLTYEGNYLYINEGNDSFRKDTNTFPIGGSWTPVALDINNDGAIDVFILDGVAQDLFKIRMPYLNNGDGIFVLDETIVASDTSKYNRGISFADIDNDGDYDAYLASQPSVSQSESRFYINDGTGNFTVLPSIDVLGEIVKGGRGSAFGDYDNDGLVDLLIGKQASGGAEWALYKNNGDHTFTKQVNSSFGEGSGFGGVSMVDYDNDGFLDILTATWGLDYNGLYHNKGNANNWLQIKLEGTISNRSAVGAKVDVYTPDGKRNHQQILTTNGFANQNSLTAQVGLGTNTAIDSVVINWPSGIKQKITELEINKRLTIKEHSFEADSLALVALYNATSGDNWNRNNNWLEAPVASWAGVSIKNQAVNGVVLPSNNLDGEIPEDFTSMTELESLNLADNKLTGVPDLTSLTQLNSIKLDSNYLDFGDLEPIVALPGLTYDNQFSFDSPLDTLIDEGKSLALSFIVGGSSNQYQWYKDNVILSDSTRSEIYFNTIGSENEGEYYAEVSSSKVPDLVITSAIRKLMVNYDVGSDSLALVALYNSTNGVNWNKNNNWLMNPVSSWEGVAIKDGHVRTLNLPKNNLDGDISEEFLTMTELEQVDFSDNKITGVPNVTGLLKLSSIKLDSNYLDFADLESIAAMPGLTYSNQFMLDTPIDTIVNEGSVLSLSFNVEGSSNEYQWFKNDVILADSIRNELYFNGIDEINDGEYYVEATNVKVPGLILTSATRKVIVESILGLDEASNLVFLPYPNPATDKIHIQWDSEDEELHMIIYNKSGTKISDQTIAKDQAHVDVSNLNAGSYIVTLGSTGGNVKGTYRIVIQR
ncbi:FG-GAP-like repeat-containing protein [Fulvivirga lutimaris]|uniref:FG-GAP-like repeat-containing protein n=1 Tax=Fulvivirga lutimaris TaxID=1819566 RepID=UPI0012BB5E0B|nr:FG-GAP-like repeat-containing protein [Fulvivirga lutimaris]MTI41773.1 T9SS type A sorting domain-containing protein [Fulvivirga lutimaris]